MFERKQEQPDFLTMLHEMKQDRIEMAKQFAAVGSTLQNLQKEMKGSHTDVIQLTTYNQTFRADGYKFNTFYLGDAAVSDNIKLIIRFNGLEYTNSLLAGENAVNIPDGAEYRVHTSSGNGTSAILVRYNMLSGNNFNNVMVTESKVMEQKTQADAVAGVVTFSDGITILEVYNTDATNAGVFLINGIDITVPASGSFKASFGGTPQKTVTVTGSTAYILTRYELGVLY